MKELEARYLERLSEISDDSKSLDRDYKPSVNPEPAERHGAFHHGYSWGVRGVFPCAQERLRSSAAKD